MHELAVCQALIDQVEQIARDPRQSLDLHPVVVLLGLIFFAVALPPGQNW